MKLCLLRFFCFDESRRGTALYTTVQCHAAPRHHPSKPTNSHFAKYDIFKKKARHLKLVTLYKSCLINDNIMNGRFRPIKGHLMTG